jgi:hypothetical protein
LVSTFDAFVSNVGLVDIKKIKTKDMINIGKNKGTIFLTNTEYRVSPFNTPL